MYCQLNSVDSGNDYQLKMRLIHSYIVYLKLEIAYYVVVESSVI